MKLFNSISPWTQSSPRAPQIPPGAEVELTTPARTASLIADLLVPLSQALVTGGLLGGLFILLLVELAPDFEGDVWKLWGGVALGIASVAWLILLGQTRRLLWALERVTGLDVDRDGVAGKPERVIFVNADQAQQEAAQRENVRRASLFADFIARLSVKGTALRAWETEIGRDTYQEYRDALIRLGWAQWNSINGDGTPNERQGWALIEEPSEILRRISG